MSVTGAPLSWQVSVYLEPDVVGRRVRRGRIVPVLATLSSPGAYRAKKTWSIEPFPMTYAQVPVTGREPGVLLDVDDLARPFDATPFPSAALTDDEIADVVLLLRTSANAVARAEATANPPRLSRDVQPWPILRMTLRNHTDVDILLLNPSTGRGGQSALIRRVSGKWTIVELRAWGSNPS